MRRFALLFGIGANLALIGFALAYGAAHWTSASRAMAADESSTRAVWELLSFALLCGAASFATIEALKRILALRGYYQARQARLWLAHRVYDTLRSSKSLDEAAELDDARGQLPWFGEAAWEEMLDAMGVEQDSVTRTFNLPNEQLAALVSSAADLTLNSGQGVHFAAALARMTPDDVYTASRAMRTRARDDDQTYPVAVVAQRIRSGVDQLQISLGERWRRYVQSAALWVAGAYGIALVHGRGFRAVDDGHLVLASVIIGGPLAWVLRDLTAVVERSRR
jgi:hypothetical protein